MRYSRQIILPNFGNEGQQKLTEAAVLVVGAGGLGVPVLQYLTAAGVGKIGIVDNDVVDISNLHRQVIYTEAEVGQNKAILAQAKMKALNSEIQIEAHSVLINTSNAKRLIRPYDIVLDCTDNFPSRYLINDACFLEKKPLIYGAIFRWEGQVSVFNHNESGNYRDLFPIPPGPDEVPNCAEGGVIGVLPGIVGCMMANECIKLISGKGSVFSGKLWILDTKTGESHIIKYKKRKDNPLSGEKPTIAELIDYDQFCGIVSLDHNESIGASDLIRWKAENKEFQLVDVREKEEYQLDNHGGSNFPMSKIKTSTHLIEDDMPVVLMCETGKRSMSILQFLKKEHEFDNLLNLKGGIKELRKMTT